MPTNSKTYAADISDFLDADEDSVLGILGKGETVTQDQSTAWLEQIEIMRRVLKPYKERGRVYFEWEIPRLGGRIDVLLLIDNAIFVIEFKVGKDAFGRDDKAQAFHYAWDLRHFHSTSRNASIMPILVATEAGERREETEMDEDVLPLVSVGANGLAAAISYGLSKADGNVIDRKKWEQGTYSPTSTVIKAAVDLYKGVKLTEIANNEAKENLSKTSDTLVEVIEKARREKHKAICFLTGVPGSGKTLAGLEIANRYRDDEDRSKSSIFLSGNRPLLMVLKKELLNAARQKADEDATLSTEKRKEARRRAEDGVKLSIQNVHQFRGEYLNGDRQLYEHLAVFDEAQRAWNAKKIAKSMAGDGKVVDEEFSEPQNLLKCFNRHKDDWAAIICLVGGGQEIHDGEGGIGEWFKALAETPEFKDWRVYTSPGIDDGAAGEYLAKLGGKRKDKPGLHLSVSVRSIRSEKVSQLVEQMLDLEPDSARRTLESIGERYPIRLTRDLQKARAWLRDQARESERYGLVVSSKAERLKPLAVDVNTKYPRENPVPWFLAEPNHIHSSCFLEDVAREFDIQGLEIDWAGMIWDADFRYDHSENRWANHEFRGVKWNNIRSETRRMYQKNAYRVLLTRARRGMVIVVPEGSKKSAGGFYDSTRDSSFYDSTYEYLKSIDFKEPEVAA